MAEEVLLTCPQLHVKLVRCDNLIAQNLASKLRAVTRELRQNQPRDDKVGKQGYACIKNAEKVDRQTKSLYDINLKEEVLENDTQDQVSVNNQDNLRLIPSIQIKAEPSISPLKPNGKSKQQSLYNSFKPTVKRKQIPPYLDNSKAGRSLPSSANHAASSLSGKLLNFKLRTNTKLQQTLMEILHLKRDYNSISNAMVQDEVKAMRWKHSLALYQESEDNIVMVDSDSNTSDDMWKYVICNGTDSYASSEPVMKWSWKVIEPEDLSEEPEVAKESPKTVMEPQTACECKSQSFEDTNTDDDGSSITTQSEVEPLPTISESSMSSLLNIDGITIEVDPVFPECPLCAEISESLGQLITHIELFHEKKVTSVGTDNSSQVSSTKETFLKQNPKINQHNKPCNKGIIPENKDNQSQHRASKKNFNALHHLTRYVNTYTNTKKDLLQRSSFNRENIPNTLDIEKRTMKVCKKETEVIVLDSDSD
ncbi:uncharacterized protein [Euwallacea similis]|uniref:uncharacterized protein n=1 Tax=Euwallacea similis TaxID=1736056 RepID=UPI00344B6585